MKILLYDQDQVIVDFDLEKKEFHFLDKKVTIISLTLIDYDLTIGIRKA